ncbi:hypothetical protein [Nocardia sp. NPDC051750]|uniref:hypothetical protein n=1 Tax=Nocardia sp. NPDC051750 TaxID=3364325 RepID=UPI0037B99FE3
MKRVTITLDDHLAALVRDAAAGGNVSAWMAEAARSRLLRAAAEAEAVHDRAHPDAEAERLAEMESAREDLWRGDAA